MTFWLHILKSSVASDTSSCYYSHLLSLKYTLPYSRLLYTPNTTGDTDKHQNSAHTLCHPIPSFPPSKPAVSPSPPPRLPQETSNFPSVHPQPSLSCHSLGRHMLQTPCQVFIPISVKGRDAYLNKQRKIRPRCCVQVIHWICVEPTYLLGYNELTSAAHVP